MALASTTWGDYPINGPILPSIRWRRTLFSALFAGVVVASCLAAAGPLFEALERSGSAVSHGFWAGVAVDRSHLSEASRSLLETNAESFLRDSLQLTRRCRVSCATIISDVAEAKRLGRFAPSGSIAGRGAGQGSSLQQSFSLPPASPPSTVADDRAGKEIVDTFAALAAIHFALVRGAAPPLPTPRLDRPSENAAAVAAIDKPMEQASLPLSLPLGGRVAPSSPVIGRNDGVAIYDISAAMVYLPNGERLEAHSGLGYMVDNPRYVDRKNTGPTPPNTYKLVGLEGRFHGVEALRLVPVDGYNKYGRDGFLTHTYLLWGRPAQSNGCVVFKDYARFLNAYKRGTINRLVVVPSLSASPIRIASASDGK